MKNTDNTLVFFALRTYVIWNRSRIIFVSVILAYIPAFTLNVVRIILMLRITLVF